ncbi:glyoxalase [Nonomuraea sp. NN258]|uniref:VOC family protein n=1 Tax=Nonomuraea antri TaxID=2730852 RepID=UPI001569989D|nr:VOC family protein [Nonomuraea antri]NRQ37343.1 glyoxalase [Nonomuraea antri]
MLNSIMYVTIYVTDQDRALRFYAEGLGLERRADYRGPDGRFLTVGVPGSPVEILLWSHPSAAARPIEGQPPGTLILESDDLRKDFIEFGRRGVTFDEPEPVDYPFGVRIETTDPDGNRISLRQRRRPPVSEPAAESGEVDRA